MHFCSRESLSIYVQPGHSGGGQLSPPPCDSAHLGRLRQHVGLKVQQLLLQVAQAGAGILFIEVAAAAAAIASGGAGAGGSGVVVFIVYVWHHLQWPRIRHGSPAGCQDFVF